MNKSNIEESWKKDNIELSHYRIRMDKYKVTFLMKPHINT